MCLCHVLALCDIALRASVCSIRETKVTVLPWDEESIKTTWFGTLHILGNINRITEPNNYAIGMSCMHDMIEILLKSEERLPPTEQPPIPLYQIFLPWLLEGCAVDDKRSKGKILAYTILCKMFCRQHPFKMDVKFLSHFYRVIQLVRRSRCLFCAVLYCAVCCCAVPVDYVVALGTACSRSSSPRRSRWATRTLFG